MPPAVPWGQLALACLTSSDESAASAHPCSEVWAVQMDAGVDLANISARATSGMLGQVGGGRELGNTPNSLDPLDGALAQAHLVEIAEVVRLRVANRLQKRASPFSKFLRLMFLVPLLPTTRHVSYMFS